MTVIQKLSDRALSQVSRVTRETLRRQRGAVRPSQGRWHKKGKGELTVVLDEALPSATNALTSPGTASASILASDGAGNLEDTGETITVVNRYEHIELEQYTLAVARQIDGEWRVVSADCQPLGSWP